MTYLSRGLGLAATLALVSTPSFVPAASAQSTSAYVYVQVGGPAGAVYGYSASPGGLLTPISGSPFKPGTQIVGATKSTFFTLGKTLIHSFGVASNGAIESQKSQIGYLNYSGSACGGGTAGIGSAELDHSGQYVYTLLQNGGDGSCAAYQTFKVNSDGSFTFEGDSEKSMTTSTSDGVSVPSILGSETFGYANEWVGHYSDLVGFRRESTGTLQVMQFNETDPTLSGSNYLPANPDADPTGNYVVVQLYPNNGGGDSNPPQIASYTVDSSGNLSTTNTTSNMPTAQLVGPGSTFSPDGTMLALYSSEGGGDGIEIYNFNGASPLTLNTRLLNGTPIDQVAWDSAHHLYAFSRAEGKLWVFNVSTGTTSSATMTALVSVASPFSMVVVGQSSTGSGGGGGGSCAAPSSDGVNVCTPDENATVTSPVGVEAAATVSGGVYRFELWNGSTKLASSDNGTLDQSVSLAPGTYHLIFVARNGSGTREYAYRDITVSGGGGATCTAPSSDGINVCTPAENATVASPVQIDAAGTVSGGVYRFEVWNGNTKLWSQDNGTIDHAISLSRGTYHLTFVARNSSGTHVYATRDITVGSGGAAAQYSAPLIGESTTVSGSVSVDYRREHDGGVYRRGGQQQLQGAILPCVRGGRVLPALVLRRDDSGDQQQRQRELDGQISAKRRLGR